MRSKGIAFAPIRAGPGGKYAPQAYPAFPLSPDAPGSWDRQFWLDGCVPQKVLLCVDRNIIHDFYQKWKNFFLRICSNGGTKVNFWLQFLKTIDKI